MKIYIGVSLFCLCVANFHAENVVSNETKFVWLESENPVVTNGIEQFNSWEHDYFSGKWLHLTVDADKLDTTITGNTVTFQYNFESTAGMFEIWNRIGFEYVRSPFDWRIDNGKWQTAKPDDLTIDLMEISFWCEIAWLKLGNVELSAGKHSLEIRLTKSKNTEGKPERILYASDCICLYPGKFEPYSKFKPNENHRTDADKKAAEHIFQLQDSLAGTWEICRNDELLPEPVTQPISQLPKTNRWSAIEVPGDKNTLRPDLQFAHRVWYRTKINVPNDAANGNHSAYLEFPQNNLNTTVYVNGKLCGFNKNPFVTFHIDISRAIKPGINEIYVGIRDAWYAYTEKSNDPMKLRRKFNLPKKYFSNGFQDLVYPVWNHPQSGILVTPTIHFMQGTVYIDDVFAKPSVAKKELTLEITLKNVSDQDQTVTLRHDCLPCRETLKNIPHKSFADQTVNIKANSDKIIMITEHWGNPNLWTPQEPYLYELQSHLTGNGFHSVWKCEFGFREWTINGKDFLLNGVPFHGWADTFNVPTKEEWLKFYRESNQTIMRFWGTHWQGMSPKEALRFFDTNGVVVRRSGIFDGEAIGYNVIEKDPELRTKNKAENPTKEEIKMDLFQNWRDQIAAQVRDERNHPSIMLWSMENEILYINCINLYSKLMDQFEDEIVKTAKILKEIDPTRFSMIDGGGATKGNALDVHGDHYVFNDFTKYPNRAYEMFPEGGGRGRWCWDGKRPRFIGEDFYVNGMHPSDFAVFAGEEAFGGRTAAKRGVGILYKILMEGYRWNEYGAWHFWVDQNRALNQYTSNAPIAVFCREYDWTFESGKTVRRTFKIFNDTQKEEHIRFTIAIKMDTVQNLPEHQMINAHEIWQQEFVVPAGNNVDVPFDLEVPDIGQYKSETKREEGTLIFSLAIQDKDQTSSQWKEVFTDKKEITILDLRGFILFSFVMNSMPPQKVDTRSSTMSTDYGCFSLLVYDPKNSVTSFFDKNKITYQKLNNLENIPQGQYGKTILLVGKDAINETNCDSPVLQAFAAQGNCVIVLEQQYPLRYGALPCEITPDENNGCTAFIENESHEVFARLRQKDFFTWTDDHFVYRNAYNKPIRGAKSLLQCGNRLANSAIVEVQVGQGVMILSQVLIGEKIEKSVVVKQLLGNLLQYASRYRLHYTPVIVCMEDLDKRLFAELETMRLKYTQTAKIADVIKTININDNVRNSTINMIVSATPKNLKTLLAEKKKLQKYYNAGGMILLHNLRPEGLADFNKLVGIEHAIRPFTRERVTFPLRRSQLTQGLSLSDIVMGSGEKIFSWANDEYVASDTYSYVVDLEDVAPFATYENNFNRMMSNGMVSADGWPYIVNVPAPDIPPLDFSLRFMNEQELCEVTWTGNTFYYPVTKFGLFFDGKSNELRFFDVAPNSEPQTFTIDPPIRGKNLTLRLADWITLSDKGKIIGLDNIELKTKRSEIYYQTVQPLLNIGAIVRYQLAKSPIKTDNGGGIVLCNLKFQENEPVPVNSVKKRNILETILRNLNAEFSEIHTVIPGTPLRYIPVDISQQCNDFRNERGWFGDTGRTFALLPRGRQTLGGVSFEVYDFPTSPVPDCVIVKNNNVLGVKIEQKTDALFFLHTAKIMQRRNHEELRNDKRFEMIRYVVHYVDGKTLDIPVDAEIDVEDYCRRKVTPIPGARLGWVCPYETSNTTTDFAVAYIKQWNNPRPEIAVKSLDIVCGKEPRGTVAVLAITAANIVVPVTVNGK
jgi:beta-galactosidase